MALLTTGGEDHERIRELYRQFLDAWNRRSAVALANLVDDHGVLVGFDGSTYEGPSQIETGLHEIFTDHPTAAYVGKVRAVRLPTRDTAILQAVAGMVPPGQSDIRSEVNAVQVLVAVRREGEWRILLLQNTPAAFHGRPEASARLTEELRAELRHSRDRRDASGGQ